MTETILYYIAIGFIIGIAMMTYVLRCGSYTSVIDSMLITMFWPFYILGLIQRKIVLWILKIIR